MASYDEGYCDHTNLTVSGIWSQDECGNQCFFQPCRHLPPPGLPIRSIDSPTWICSTSRGLVLCRDSMSNYYVGNPFLGGSIAFHTLPSLRRPHPPNTPAVIAIDLEEPHAPIFHVICAVREGAEGFYTFDTFSSNTRVWRYNEGINLQRCDPKPTTGVSCGRIAYWLTRIPLLAVRYDIRDNAATFLSLIEPVPQEILWSQTTRLQLGRVGDKLGLLVANGTRSRVELHILRGFSRWEPPCFLEVRIREDANWDQMASLWNRGDILICGEMPKLIRFESFKMEVPLWVNGWVILWVSNTNDPRRKCLMLPVHVGCKRTAGADMSECTCHLEVRWLIFFCDELIFHFCA